MQITFYYDRNDERFVLEGERAENRGGDLFLDDQLVGWYNIPDNGWFISGSVRGRPSRPVYWNRAEISTCPTS